ncbi:hypothetical protein KTE71_21465 [Burkholderia multivorans]|nr:hypothetical protein [Burkholderia multivorans]
MSLSPVSQSKGRSSRAPVRLRAPRCRVIVRHGQASALSAATGTVHERRTARAQDVLAEGNRRGDRQRRRAFVGQRHAGFLEIRKEATARGCVALTGFAEPDGARRPVESRGAGVGLEQRDRAAARGRQTASRRPAPARLRSSSVATNPFIASIRFMALARSRRHRETGMHAIP